MAPFVGKNVSKTIPNETQFNLRNSRFQLIRFELKLVRVQWAFPNPELSIPADRVANLEEII